MIVTKWQKNYEGVMFDQVPDDFPILAERINGKPLIYFDNAATTHKPQVVLDALQTFYTKYNANIHRGIYLFAEHATQLYEQARATVAQFVRAQLHEIIFTSGTTQSINFVARTWGEQFIMPGDEIVITQLEHHANILPWQQLAHKKGALLRTIPVHADGTMQYESLARIITDKTKLVAVCQVSNALGVRIDIAQIKKYTQRVGARLLVDAAQSAPHEQLDMKRLDADFVAFSGHKMMGPTGIGILFIKEELHDLIPPYQYGGGMVFDADFDTAHWHKSPTKFEAGTPPIAQAVGLAAAIDYIQKNINFDQLRTHEEMLMQRLVNGLQEIEQVTLHGPINTIHQPTHLLSFSVDGIHAHDIAAYLSHEGIFVRAGHQCAQPLMKVLSLKSVVRVSFYCYNTITQVDTFITTLKQIIALHSGHLKKRRLPDTLKISS